MGSVQQLKKPVVLVVEDDPLQMMIAGDLVEDALAPIFAQNADEAIVMLEGRDDIRIVLTDVDMPGSMDGLRLAAIVRNRWPPIQLVVVSGHMLLEHAELPERSRFFNKPYAPDKMIGALRSLVA
ncbi:response regulator [Bradyrhizobium sp. LTSP849]|uniref:response regulator n=1 Tax=Bradyrhizobium sp. LTSP849 TaxID=1615890 RepID=UPI000AA2BD33|nr:response regulator [Bradyrhizobium sp. LTSP849]